MSHPNSAYVSICWFLLKTHPILTLVPPPCLLNLLSNFFRQQPIPKDYEILGIRNLFKIRHENLRINYFIHASATLRKLSPKTHFSLTNFEGKVRIQNFFH